MEVRVFSRDIEKALRTLKKKLQLDGVFGELKKRRFYEKPSVKKKRKQAEAQKRKRKLLKRSRQSGWSPRPGTGNAAHPGSSSATTRTVRNEATARATVPPKEESSGKT